MDLDDGEPILSRLSASVEDQGECSSAASAARTSAPGAESPCQVAVTATRNGSVEEFQQVELVRSLDGVHVDGIETWNKLDGMCIDGSDKGTETPDSDCRGTDIDIVEASFKPPSIKTEKPFHRWMKTLHRRAVQRQALGGSQATYPPNLHAHRFSHHRQSSSGSSTAFVTAVRSASVSLASTSFLSRSRRNLRSSRGDSKAGRSSRASISGARMSTDSTCAEMTAVDPSVMERSLQRRRVLEELIETEEGYIGDVRFLMNVYITILASLPTLSPGLRSSINQNLTDIVELHETLLGDLHRVVSHSEYTQLDVTPPTRSSSDRGHKRWRSLDAVPEDKVGLNWLQAIPGMTSEPQVAAEVAKVFSKKMNRFFIYEEYGAKYELMIKDLASAHRTMPKWESYQKGLEALAAALGSGKHQDESARKSLTIGDLLMKPIQRVCRYPLLFTELLKYTPVCDCPYSHMEIEDTLIRLREATAEINRATDDKRIKATLEKTWVLQDRLVFPNHSLDAISKNTIRSLGHIHLCGALHVCWQTKESVAGQYMVSLLYRNWLCLALASRFDQVYTIQACINITTAKIEEVDNGRGIQCHTAPHSWKVVFLSDHQLYEVIMTACNPKEEQEWRTRLALAAAAESLTSPAAGWAAFDSLSLNIKPLGTVFGKPGTIARRISVHRATTVSPKTPLYQVILRNTSVVSSAPATTSTGPGGSSTSINRSMSLLTKNMRTPVLAPSRADRARLEALLSDVWTRDILPFPGITARSRSEYLVKASAGAMMRKLSVASITGSFKRGGSKDSRGDSEDTLVSSYQQSRHSTRQASSSNDGDPVFFRRSSFLCSIPDDEKTGAPSYPSYTASYTVPDSEWGADVLKTINHMVDDARKGSGRSDGTICSSDVLRPSTPASSNKRVKRRASTLTALSLACDEKDMSPKRVNGKWPRIKIGSVRHKEVVRGFKSLFR